MRSTPAPTLAPLNRDPFIVAAEAEDLVHELRHLADAVGREPERPIDAFASAAGLALARLVDLGRLPEPDAFRRVTRDAFIGRDRVAVFEAAAARWLPLVHTRHDYLRDADLLGERAATSQAMRRIAAVVEGMAR